MEVGETGGRLGGNAGYPVTNKYCWEMLPKLLWLLLFALAAKSAVPRTWDGYFWGGENSCRCWVWGETGSWYPAPIFAFASLKLG